MDTFYKYTQQEYFKLISLDLTFSEWKLYEFLAIHNPFMDREIEIDTSAIAEKTMLKRRTIQKALKRLAELRLITLDIIRFKYSVCPANCGSPDAVPVRQDAVPVRQDAVPVRQDAVPVRQDALESLLDKDSKTSQTIQINQTIQTPPLPPQGEKEREEILIDGNGKGGRVDNSSVGSQETAIIISPQSEVIQVDPYSPVRSTRRNKNTTQNLPDGPWMVEYKTPHGRVEKKLDQNFIKYMADTWFKDPGFNKNGCKDIYQVMIDVVRYFKKDPSALSDRWEQYSMAFRANFENAQLRTQHGIDIKPEEQEYLLNHVRAVTNPLPEEMSYVAPKELLPSQPVALSPANWTDNIPENADNAGAYKPYQPLQEEYEPISPEKMAEIRKKMLKVGIRLPDAPLEQIETPAQRLQRELNDPILHSEALKRARGCDSLSIDFDGCQWIVSEEA